MPRPITILPDPPPPPTAVGLIAGGGRLPIIVAEGLKEEGRPVHGLGLGKHYDPELPALCDTFREVGILRVGTWGKRLRQRGVRHAIMVGRIDKAQIMHDPLRAMRYIPDLRTALGWLRRLRHDRRSHAVLELVADELDRTGVQLLDSTSPIREHLATPGVMTRRAPSTDQEADVEFAWPLLTELLRLDIGQAIAVRERDVIAVEAVEGTDRLIERVRELCRASGWTLCKGARAGHDRRADVPTVGIKTLENLHAHGGRCLALASGDVIMIDKPEMIQRADELGIAIIGVTLAQA